MEGPDPRLREYVAERADEADSEEALEVLLEQIEGALAADISTGLSDSPDETLAIVETWASLASAACARFYAPASPWRQSVAGWSQGAAAHLRSIANSLKGPLQAVASALAAVGFSISVSFPWGISIGVSW